MFKTKVLTNQIGYDTGDSKKAVLQTTADIKPKNFELINLDTDEAVFSGGLTEIGTVANWNTGYYYTINFDEFNVEGEYIIKVYTDNGTFMSFPFKIENNLLEMKTLSSVGYYFKAQRPTGEIEAADRNLPFKGSKDGVFDYRQGRRDVRGGWLDATGDYGVHLSHLSHTSYFNPQQSAFSAYAFFKIADLLEESKYPYYTMLKRRMLDEGMYGADFLMRMRTDSGTFFRSKGRGECFKSVERTRNIAYEYRKPGDRKGGGVLNGFDEITDDHYECSFRSGAGFAITALAYAARTTFPSNYSKEEYIATAINALTYLESNNEKYTNDGKSNLLDEYCYLNACIEIYKTTKEYDYLRKARATVKSMKDKYVSISDDMGYLSVNGTDRPFFHCGDAGLPMVVLLEYIDTETDDTLRDDTTKLVEKLMRHELSVTNEVNNPFGYARQLVLRGDGKLKNQFFYPHDVETSPWWQGENARIASLATAARKLSFIVKDESFKLQLNKYADDQINWVLGLNPYDACMMEGYGRNNNPYFYQDRRDFIHCPGGISNGITSGLHDEDSIEYIMKPTEEIDDNWRWAEQWIPHASWYMYALAAKKR